MLASKGLLFISWVERHMVASHRIDGSMCEIGDEIVLEHATGNHGNHGNEKNR